MAKSDVLVRMKADTQNYDANIAKARRQLDQFKKDNLSMGGVMKQLNGTLMATAARFASVTAAIGAAGAAFKSNIETAKNFEKSMSQLSSLTGMVGSDLEKLKGYAIELGSSTTLSASQVADAFKMIGSQQPQLLASGEALKAVTKNAITLAEAAGIELSDAAKTLSVSINQMGGDSNNAERYINVLAAAAQKGAGDIVWLGEAITKSGTTAKAVGTDYEELVANLEQLAKAGYDASTAGTALRSIIMNLEKQANQQYKPSVVGLTEAFKNLGQANLTLTEYQGIAGKMFAAQAKALADAAAEAKNMKEEITGTNIAEDQAKTNTDNLDGSLKSLASAWEGLNLHINDSNGFLRTCVDWLKDVVVWADQAFTAAGRAQKKLLEMQGGTGGSNSPTKVDQQITNLNGGSLRSKEIRYNKQVENYNRYINERRNYFIKLQQWLNSQDEGVRQEVLNMQKKFGTANKTEIQDQMNAAIAMLNEYKTRAEQILHPKTPTEDTTDPAGGGGGKDKNKKTKNELTELQENQKKINELTQQYVDIMGAAAKAGNPLTDEQKKQTEEIQNQIRELEKRNGLLGLFKEQAQGRMLLNAGDVNMQQRFNNGSLMANPFASDSKKSEIGKMKLTLDDKAMKSVMQGVQNSLPKKLTTEQKIDGMRDLLGGVEGIFSGIQQMGVQIPEDMQRMFGVLNGIMTIVASIESIITVGQFLGVFSNGGVVHAANGFSGVVPGNHFSGDNVPALLNSGEVVLNRAQQGAIAGALQGGGGQTVHVVGKLSGESLFLCAENWAKRTGRGEFVTWR